MAAGMPAPIDSIDIPIQGMTCASCVGRVEKALNRLEGATAQVNLATETSRPWNMAFREALFRYHGQQVSKTLDC